MNTKERAGKDMWKRMNKILIKASMVSILLFVLIGIVSADSGCGLYFIAIANEDTDEKCNDELVEWIKKFPNWRDLKVYDGTNPQDKSNPIWKLDNKYGQEITNILDDFRVTHPNVLEEDIVIFYYAGHMTSIPDLNNDEEDGRDEALMKNLFSIDVKFEEDLNNGVISEELQNIFRDNGFPLSPDATVAKKEENKWEITTDGEKFLVVKERGELNIYGSDSVITDDELAQKLNAIGRRGTLRIVILDTCYAHAFWTGDNDLKTLHNEAFFFSTGEDELCYTPKWHDSILRIKNINEIDKGYTDVTDWIEPANNGLVTVGKWADWTRKKAEDVGTEVPGYTIGVMGEKQWKRPVFTIAIIESCDKDRKVKNIFCKDERVYVKGIKLKADVAGNIYVVDNQMWTDGMDIKNVKPGAPDNYCLKENVTAQEDDDFVGSPIELGKVSNDPGPCNIPYPRKYDIVYDVNQNKIYNSNVDLVDKVTCTGFETVPEFATIAIPVATILGLVFLFSRRKRKE